MTGDEERERLAALVRDIPDFPKAGIVFKDITPLLGDRRAFATAIDLIAERFVDRGITRVLGIEARGFIVAAPVAYRLGAGFIPARKQGKLPYATLGVDYDLEYGAERLEVHSDAVSASDRVLIVDDVLATGGTARAACDVIGDLGADVAGVGVIIELAFLGGRERLARAPSESGEASEGRETELFSILTYE